MTMMGRSRRSDFSALALSALALLLVLFFGSSAAPYLQGLFEGVIGARASGAEYAGMSRDALISRLQESDAALARVGYQSYLYELIVAENEALRNASSVESFATAIPARVVARPPRTHYDTLILDQGEAAGISENDLVVKDGVALGTVVSRGTSTATVRLFTTPGVLQDAILGEPTAIAVAKGVGGGAFELQVPQNVAVVPGEAIRIPHSDTLILGVVVATRAKPSDAAQTVFAKSPVSLQTIDYVSVLPQGDI